MRKRFISAIIISAIAGAAACSSSPHSVTADDPGFDVVPVVSVEVYATGGIAGLVTDWRIVRPTRQFFYVNRRSCTSAGCPAALDSAAGTLSQAAIDSIFNVVIPRDTAGTVRDYGTTPNAADMRQYVVRVTNGDQTTDLRADDGTMPPPMRAMIDAVRGTIAAARQ
jgi:hypothetical protein